MRKLADDRMKRRLKLQETMLFKMQYMQGLEHTVAELNKIFEANHDLKLTRWIVFRAWYKNQIDHMVERPEIYHLSLDGKPYAKEDDPLYDVNAPDWALYDREHYYDDDDDDFEDDDDDFDDEDEREDDDDAFAMGMGMGVVNGLTGGAVFGSGDSGGDS